MKDITRRYAQQNGKLRGQLESLICFFDKLDRGTIKEYLENMIKEDIKFDKKIKELRK